MCYTGNQPWKDSLEAIHWKGFKQEHDMEGFEVENQQTFSKDEVCQTRVTILNRNSKWQGNRPKAIWFKILLGDLIKKKKDMTVGNKIMKKCIGFGSTAVISYAQIQ
jgi:hypothetical protein